MCNWLVAWADDTRQLVFQAPCRARELPATANSGPPATATAPRPTTKFWTPPQQCTPRFSRRWRLRCRKRGGISCRLMWQRISHQNFFLNLFAKVHLETYTYTYVHTRVRELSIAQMCARRFCFVLFCSEIREDRYGVGSNWSSRAGERERERNDDSEAAEEAGFCQWSNPRGGGARGGSAWIVNNNYRWARAAALRASGGWGWWCRGDLYISSTITIIIAITPFFSPSTAQAICTSSMPCSWWCNKVGEICPRVCRWDLRPFPLRPCTKPRAS